MNEPLPDLRLTLKRQSSPNGDPTGTSPPEGVEIRQHSESPPQVRRTERRAKTISAFSIRPRLSFRTKSPEPVPTDDFLTRRKSRGGSNSQFFEANELTKHITEPRDFPKLDLKDKETGELLRMLRPVS